MSMDARSKLVRAFQEFGGRVSSEQLLKFIKDDEALSQETKCSMKKIIASIAVIEYGPDQKRYLVLKDLVRDKENLVYNTVCQATQTSAPQLQETHTTPKLVLSSQSNQSTRSPVVHKPHPPVSTVPSALPTFNTTTASSPNHKYSTYTSNETRLWWIAAMNCRLADMSRLLGLNPKLVNWADPVSGTALHYAAKFGNLNCARLLVNQYHADVNIRSRGRTPLHIAAAHAQRVLIRALVEDFKADSAIMDFSGYFPYMLLEDDLKKEYEPLLTHGRLKRILTAVSVFKAANASQDSLTVNKDTASKRSAPELPSEFKYPAMLPTTVKRMENFKQRSTPSNLTQHDSLNRTSTLKLISQNGGGSGGCEYTHRRPSVFESILKSAADAAQNWNIKNSGEKIPTESNVQKEGQHDSSNDQPRIDSTNHPYIRLVQRLDSLISLRRERVHQSLVAVGIPQQRTATVVNRIHWTIDPLFLGIASKCTNFVVSLRKKSKTSNQSPDFHSLKLLLSLLPPPSEPLFTEEGNGSNGKLKKHSISSFHRQLRKKLNRSLSNSSALSLTISSHHHSISNEFHSLPHRYHSSSSSSSPSSPYINGHHKSLSATAILAETDVRQLLTTKTSTLIKRKTSSISQESSI
ncbi:unnamed protein product [Heterobilharzia americana]|nr:unnamed protein product [Heterobilharzia americana]